MQRRHHPSAEPVQTATVRIEVLGALQRVSPSVEAADERCFLDLRGLQEVYRHSLRRLEARHS